MLGLRFYARAFSSCGKQGSLFIAVRGPLTVAASLVAEHKLQTCRLSSCGSRAQLLRRMWDSPRPALEPVSPALAGRFSTTAPPGKPLEFLFTEISDIYVVQEDTGSRGSKCRRNRELGRRGMDSRSAGSQRVKASLGSLMGPHTWNPLKIPNWHLPIVTTE